MSRLESRMTKSPDEHKFLGIGQRPEQIAHSLNEITYGFQMCYASF
jgi:hypothetical protein